jgi:hypothetical protein
VRLKLSPKKLAASSRSADPSLAQLAPLIRIPRFDLAKRLQEESIFQPGDYYYVGRHFLESQGDEKEFGQNMLEFLLRVAPDTGEAKKARKDLKKKA